VEMMTDDDNGATLAMLALGQRLQQVFVGRILMVRKLVQEQDVRFDCAGPRHRETLTLPAGEAQSRLLFIPGKADGGHCRFTAPVRDFSGNATPSEGQRDVVQDRRLEKPDVLLNVPDLPPKVCASGTIQSGPISPIDEGLARAGWLQPEQEAQDGRLSRPRRAEDDDEGAARPTEVHPLKERTAFQGHRDLSQGELRRIACAGDSEVGQPVIPPHRSSRMSAASAVDATCRCDAQTLAPRAGADEAGTP